MGKGGMAARVGDLERKLTVTVDVGPIKDAMQECVADLDRLESGKASKDSVDKLRTQLQTGFATTEDLAAVSAVISQLGARVSESEALYADTKRKLAAEQGKTEILESTLHSAEEQLQALASRMQTAEARAKTWDEQGKQLKDLSSSVQDLDARIEAQENAHARAMETIARLVSMCDTHESKLKEMQGTFREMGSQMGELQHQSAETRRVAGRNTAAGTPAAGAQAQDPAALLGPRPFPPKPSKAEAQLPSDLAAKLAKLDQLGSDVNQLHTQSRECRQEITVLKREADLQRGLHSDTVGQLSGVQDRLEEMITEITANVLPYVPRMRSLPAALLQMENQISSLGDYSQESLAVISDRLQGKADKSAVLPMQKALVLLRDMLFDANHSKCAVGRKQIRCLTCDTLHSHMTDVRSSGVLLPMPPSTMAPASPHAHNHAHSHHYHHQPHHHLERPQSPIGPISSTSPSPRSRGTPPPQADD